MNPQKIKLQQERLQQATAEDRASLLDAQSAETEAPDAETIKSRYETTRQDFQAIFEIFDTSGDGELKETPAIVLSRGSDEVGEFEMVVRLAAYEMGKIRHVATNPYSDGGITADISRAPYHYRVKGGMGYKDAQAFVATFSFRYPGRTDFVEQKTETELFTDMVVPKRYNIHRVGSHNHIIMECTDKMVSCLDLSEKEFKDPLEWQKELLLPRIERGESTTAMIQAALANPKLNPDLQTVNT